MTSAAWVIGVGAVSPAGVGADRLANALAQPEWRPLLGLDRPDGPPLPVAKCSDFSPKDHLPPLVARRLDRSARLFIVAAREALAAAANALPGERERIGVCAGTWNAGTEALVEVLRAVFLASPDEAPPMQFPSTVANAAAAQLGILEKLGGPNLTFAEKQVGGLRAIAEAADLLRRGRAAAVLAGGVDEAQWLNAEGYDRLRSLVGPGRDGMILGEGAGVLLLAGEPRPRPLARLAGWGSASSPAPPHRYPAAAGGLTRACLRALSTAGIAASDVDLVVSCANGIERVAELEAEALSTVFGAARPAAVSVTDRLGEGAVAGAVRAIVAVSALAGLASPAWPSPAHLLARGLPSLTSAAHRGSLRTALVPGVAAGGSAIALVFTTA